MFGRRKIATLVAEFLGTGILTLLVLSVQRSTIGIPFFVALAAGITLAVTVAALHETSGAHFNPALTIALWTARKVSTLTAVVYIAVQLVGAWLAYYLYTFYVNNTLQPVGGHFTKRILIAEAVGTAIFAFGVASTVYKKHISTVTAAYTGLAYMIGIIAASSASIGLLNPALALGIRAWTPSVMGTWGTYLLGPILGAVIGVNLYGLLFAPGDGLAVATVAPAAPRVTAAAATTAARKPRKAAAKKPAAKRTTARRKTTK